MHSSKNNFYQKSREKLPIRKTHENIRMRLSRELEVALSQAKVNFERTCMQLIVLWFHGLIVL